MRPLRALRGFILPGLTPKAQWWLGAAVVASLLCVAGAIWSMAGNYTATAVYVGWAVWVMLGRSWERRRFREGWHAGFVEGALAGSGERLPDGALRQMATGDPAAEPWDDVAQHVQMFVHEHGPHCRRDGEDNDAEG